MKINLLILVLLVASLLLYSCNDDNINDKNVVKESSEETDSQLDEIGKYIGVYKYQYEFNTDDWKEDSYIVLEEEDGIITGRYYGTTDDFDEAREGYYPGFFVTDIINPEYGKNNISFNIKLKDSDLLSTQIDIKYKKNSEISLEDNPKWLQGDRYSGIDISVDYIGTIYENDILLESEYFVDPKLFMKQ